jgi:hypothetical protein
VPEASARRRSTRPGKLAQIHGVSASRAHIGKFLPFRVVSMASM